MARLKEIAHSTQKAGVVYQMSLFTDATQDGADNRRAQAMADAQSLMNVYGLKGDEVEGNPHGPSTRTGSDCNATTRPRAVPELVSFGTQPGLLGNRVSSMCRSLR